MRVAELEVLAIGKGNGMSQALGSFDHVGITVPDLNEATAFFASVLDWEEVLRDGPFSDPTGNWMSTALDIHRETSINLALLKTGPETFIELFECSAPDQEQKQPRIADLGGCHLAIRVDDLAVAISRLKQVEGVRILAGPNDGSAGSKYIYFVAPWGLPMELIER